MGQRIGTWWAWFRQRPGWTQAIGWAIAWPVLTALWAVRRGTAGKVAAVMCLLVLLPLWVVMVGSWGEQPAAEEARLPAGVPVGAQTATVARHVDGDTVWVEVTEPGGPLPPAAVHKIRLLLMDTPETVDPSQGPECWGPEASEFAAQQLPLGSTVHLVADEEDTDRYGRFLRYAWTADGTFFNEAAVAHGHARVVVYQPNDAYLEPLRVAEAAAKAADRGMWGPPCDYRAAPPAGSAPPPPAEPPPPPAGGGSGGDGCDPNYSGCVPVAPDVDCAGGGGDGPAYVRGPVDVLRSDVHGLDRDGDGTACN